ncbi:hypothetical protein DSLASN_46590 [Desulfoluna limicola]|uniref:Uncharacterized protein n=1 Tax=Desulfoluna limicola TaxID=2810562 RepID=A0ABN6F9B9_9BACT|nr:hypothetical protein DSLASN_46590 [Desulfoluna limicola]
MSLAKQGHPMGKIVPILLILYFAMWVFVFCIGFIYKRRLKLLYPDIGANLHPGLMNKSISSDFKSTRFLIRGGYRSLDNYQFMRFSDRYRALVITWYIVFGVSIVSLVIFFIMNGKQ